MAQQAGGVFRSTDGGASTGRASIRSRPRSFYFSKIVVDPKDESRLYIPGFGLDVSDDGGKTSGPTERVTALGTSQSRRR